MFLFFLYIGLCLHEENLIEQMDILGSSYDHIKGKCDYLERVHSIDMAVHPICCMQRVFRLLCGLPFVHAVVIIPKESHSRSVLDGVASHCKFQVRNTEISNDLVHKDMVCWNVPHSSKLHGS